MVDVNFQVKKILGAIEGANAVFYHPESFNKLPVISYYELTTATGLCYDNEEQGQCSHVCIDIWAKGGDVCAWIAIAADAAMQKEGWYREFSRDLPKENGIFHKNMRFSKDILFEED